jgi:hypothetical protein
MVSKCCCDNGCMYCKEYDDETGKNDYPLVQEDPCL